MKKFLITNGGRAMNIFRLIVTLVILTSLCNAQNEGYKSSEKLIERKSTTDTSIIQSIINKIITSTQNGRVDVLNRYIIDGLNTSKTSNAENYQLSRCFLSKEGISITVSGDNATAEFSFFNSAIKEEKKEIMSFVRTNGEWKIKNSSSLVNSILQKTTVLEQKTSSLKKSDSQIAEGNLESKSQINSSLTLTTSSAEYNISEFILSSSALIKRYALNTPQNSNITTINLSLAKQQLNGAQVFNSINEGKFARLSGGGSFGVIADRRWNRIVYGSPSVGLVKTYGDNSNDNWLSWASSIALDKFGNVLVLANYPPKIYKFLYTSGTMNFLNTITLPGVQEVTDICMDDNFSPNNQSDDTFWLTDIKGNAIFNLTLDGNFPAARSGIYTRVINAAGGEVVFNKPTRIVANYGSLDQTLPSRNLAIIDSDKKRIIIIDIITGYEGNNIHGEYTVVNFTGQTNVSLNSIGYSYSWWSQAANGLWVADPNNGMFHIFDGGEMRSGYLGSVQSLSPNGAPEWNSPKSLVSTAMSNSEPDDIAAFVTLDTYDDTHGINTYYAGADMVNIVASPNSLSGEVDITASFINYSRIQSINIYNSGGTLIYTLPYFNYYDKDRESARGYVCSIEPSHIGNNLLGAYKASFTFASGYNDEYESDYQQTVTRDVQFAMPLACYITGNSWGISGTSYSWQANMTSGSGNFTYTWYKQSDGSNVWDPITSSNGSTCSLLMGSINFTLKCDVTDNFNGQIKSFTQHISSGKLVADETWSGLNNITGTVTIPAGITLTIENPQSSQYSSGLNFANGTSLIVNGTLKVNGTSSKQIVFGLTGGITGAWGPLKFDGSTALSSVLDNVAVINCTNIQVVNNANVTIQNSYIKDCIQGIYVYNASPKILNNRIWNPVQHGIYVDAPNNIQLILDNTITKTSDRVADYKHQEGIIMYNGTVGYIAHNDITGFDHGIYVGGGSIAKFTNTSWQNYYPNNRLTGNRYGVMVGWGSTLLGGDGTNSCWNNNISNNDSYNAFIYQSSWAIAQNNYWGVRFFKQYVDASSNFYALPSLTSDPWISTGGGGSQSIIAATSEFPELQPSSSNAKSVFTSKELSKQFQKDELDNNRSAAKNEDELLKEINFEKEGKIDEAIEHLKKMIKNKKYSMYAITTLGVIKGRYGKDYLQTYFEDLLKDPNEGNKSRIKKHLAGFYLDKDEDDKASVLFDELKDDKRSKKDNFEGLYEKFNYMIHKKKDVVLAKNLLDEMKNKFADDEEANIHIATAEMLISNVNNNHPFGKKQNETAVEVINEYALSNNYPNPFNPVTIINYQLPKSGSVSLKIFDILGNEVRILVNEQKEMGKYTVQFDASSLASGMYVYQLRANDYTSTKKMLLLK